MKPHYFMQIDPSSPNTHTHTLYYATYTRNHQSARWNMCKSIMQTVSIHIAVSVRLAFSRSLREHHHALCYATWLRNHQSARWNMCGQRPNAPRGRRSKAQLQTGRGAWRQRCCRQRDLQIRCKNKAITEANRVPCTRAPCLTMSHKSYAIYHRRFKTNAT